MRVGDISKWGCMGNNVVVSEVQGNNEYCRVHICDDKGVLLNDNGRGVVVSKEMYYERTGRTPCNHIVAMGGGALMKIGALCEVTYKFKYCPDCGAKIG